MRKIYSFATFMLRVAKYEAAMGAYQKQLWSRVLPALESAPEETQDILNTYAEALTVSRHQRLASRHSADVSAKTLVSAVALRRHAWFRASGIIEDAKKQIEDQPFNAKGLFSEKTDDSLENLHKIKKTAKSYTVVPCMTMIIHSVKIAVQRNRHAGHHCI